MASADLENSGRAACDVQTECVVVMDTQKLICPEDPFES